MRENVNSPTDILTTGDVAEAKSAAPVGLHAVVSRLVVAYGGGVNSTAMLVEMHRRGIRTDLILFADTGGERPETYRTVWLVSEWCKLHGMPQIITVRNPGPTSTRAKSAE